MLRRYRGTLIAAFGVVLLGAALPPDERKSTQPQHSEQHQETIGNPVAASPPPVQQANEPPSYTNPCQAGHDDRSSDLCAQWNAADAAQQSANWTTIGAIVGAFTLAAAMAAAYYAKEAARHTQRSADIAEKALLDIERPYLFVTATKPLVGVTHDWADKPDNKRPIPEAAYSIKNFGRTPAIINEIRASLRLCNLPPTPHYHPGEINDVERVLGADDALSPAAFDRGGPITNNVLNELFLSDTHIGAGSLPYVSVWRDHLFERQRDHRPIRIYLPLLASRQYVPFAGHSRLHLPPP